MDDDEAILEFITMALVDEGYEVAAAENGEAGLQQINLAQPDLIILDMRMPILDGEGFLSAYHSGSYPAVPIIALSAAHGFLQASPLPVTALIAKPFDLGELLACVRKHLRPGPN